jgi:hypothetical protein
MWTKFSDDKRTLWIHFEDLQVHREREIQRIAKFAGLKCDEKILEVVMQRPKQLG